MRDHNPSPPHQRLIMQFVGLVILFASIFTTSRADDPIFSGPQPGEVLTPFKARWAYGDSVGKQFDIVAEADGGPVAIIFVHELTRPSIGLTRVLMNFAAKREADKLKRAVVFLAGDATAMETRLKRAQHALPDGLPIGISVDGKEGPGAYGLNRKVALTVLVATENKVTANFTLVQPSLTDAPDIGLAIEKLFGSDEKPTLEAMGATQSAIRGQMNRRNGQIDDGTFRAMMGPVIQKTATKEQVDKAATAVEEMASKNPAFRQRVAEVTNRIIDAGRLESYGTPAAREYLTKWSKQFTVEDQAPEKTPERASDKSTNDEEPDAANSESGSDSESNEEASDS